MFKKSKKLIVTLVLIMGLLCLNCTAAFAATTSVSIYYEDDTTALKTFTTAQLGNFTQHGTHNNPVHYSTYCCKQQAYRYFDAYGVDLKEVLLDATDAANEADLLATYSLIKFIGSDGEYYSFSLKDVLNGYYYATPQSTPVSVPAIIATAEFCEVGGSWDTTNYMRSFFGQPNGFPGATSMKGWEINLNSIRLYE